MMILWIDLVTDWTELNETQHRIVVIIFLLLLWLEAQVFNQYKLEK